MVLLFLFSLIFSHQYFPTSVKSKENKGWDWTCPWIAEDGAQRDAENRYLARMQSGYRDKHCPSTTEAKTRGWEKQKPGVCSPGEDSVVVGLGDRPVVTGERWWGPQVENIGSSAVRTHRPQDPKKSSGMTGRPDRDFLKCWSIITGTGFGMTTSPILEKCTLRAHLWLRQ